MEPLIDIRNLRVAASTGDGPESEIVKSVSFAVKRGEVMGLIGESGSGKTTIALAVMGYTRYGCRISGGSIRVGGTEVTELDARALAALRGRRVAYIAQSAAAAFNPSRMIMAQVIESALIHGTASKAEAMAKAVGLFRALAIPSPETIGSRYPHQVSGGQLQRLMAAMALITDPEVVIFDEPTTALDVTTQIEVLKAFKTQSASATPPVSTSRTISLSSRRSPTASPCCAMASCRKQATSGSSLQVRKPSIREACWRHRSRPCVWSRINRNPPFPCSRSPVSPPAMAGSMPKGFPPRRSSGI